MVGDVDPEPILDALAVRASENMFTSWDDMQRGSHLQKPTGQSRREGDEAMIQWRRVYDAKKRVRGLAEKALLDAGFVPHEVVEVWLGAS
jgi:hypothetical protein